MNEIDRLFYSTLASLLEQRVAFLLAIFAPTGVATMKEAFVAAPVRAAASRPVPDSTATTRGSRGERSNLPVGQPTHRAGGPAARAEWIRS